jgi:translation elongation factor EF-G
MRLSDGLLLVVDVLEGVGCVTERAIQQAVAEGLAITLVISKVTSYVAPPVLHHHQCHIKSSTAMPTKPCHQRNHAAHAMTSSHHDHEM